MDNNKYFQHALSDHSRVKGHDIAESQVIILIVPAMGAPARLYNKLYHGIIRAGASVAIMNLRGDGRLDKKYLTGNNNFGYTELLEDIDTVFELLTDKYPSKDIVIFGHSLGGQLGCLYNCHKHPRLKATIVVAGGNMGYQNWTGTDRLKTYFVTQFFGILSLLLSWFPGKKIGFGGNQPKNVMIDWSKNARTGRYVLTNQIMDYENQSQEVRSLFLGIVIDTDFFAPYASTKSLLDKFPQSDTKVVTLKTKAFKTISPDHFRWLKEPGPVIDTFVSWACEKGLIRNEKSAG